MAPVVTVQSPRTDCDNLPVSGAQTEGEADNRAVGPQILLGHVYHQIFQGRRPNQQTVDAQREAPDTLLPPGQSKHTEEV